MRRFSFLALALIGTGFRPASALAARNNQVSGIIVSINGAALVLKKRNNTTLNVDLTEAVANGHAGVLSAGMAIVLHGTRQPDGTFHCVYTSHAGPELSEWAADQ